MHLLQYMGDVDKDDNYIKEERKLRKRVQRVLGPVEFGAGKLVKQFFAAREEWVKRHLRVSTVLLVVNLSG